MGQKEACFNFIFYTW